MKFIVFLLVLFYSMSVPKCECETFKNKNPEFDSLKWKEERVSCELYRINIQERLNIDGLSRECILKMMGAPDSQNKNSCTYILSYVECPSNINGHSELVLLFSKGKVKSSTLFME